MKRKMGTGPDDLCPCGRGRLFKDCHEPYMPQFRAAIRALSALDLPDDPFVRDAREAARKSGGFSGPPLHIRALRARVT